MGIHIMTPLYKMVIAPPGPPPYGPEITTRFYPTQADYGNAVDGYTCCAAVDNSWADTHDGPGAACNYTPPNLYTDIYAGNLENMWRYIHRTIMLFETTTLPAGALILSAKLAVRGITVSWPAAWSPSVAVYGSFPLHNNYLVNADYQAFHSTPLSNKISFSALNKDDFNIFTLNPAGLAFIIPADITKLGLRESSYDGPNTPPPWVRFGIGSFQFSSADNEFALRPYLEVTYQLPL